MNLNSLIPALAYEDSPQAGRPMEQLEAELYRSLNTDQTVLKEVEQQQKKELSEDGGPTIPYKNRSEEFRQDFEKKYFPNARNESGGGGKERFEDETFEDWEKKGGIEASLDYDMAGMDFDDWYKDSWLEQQYEKKNGVPPPDKSTREGYTELLEWYLKDVPPGVRPKVRGLLEYDYKGEEYDGPTNEFFDAFGWWRYHDDPSPTNKKRLFHSLKPKKRDPNEPAS